MMPAARSLALLLCVVSSKVSAADEPPPLPKVAEAWKVELVAEAPRIVFPTAIVSAPDGAVYLGQDPMDMHGPPTTPSDSVVRLRNGELTVFADKLWAVMGLEWVDGTLFVVHAPYLSAFRDTDGDGRADERIDLITGLGPKVPGFSGINDHIASGIRLGMDGFLYISVGDKGIPKGVGKDGATIQLFGGGVIRIRPDGTGLEVVSTGERNPLSVALTSTDEVFSYGNDDDSKQWPNSLTNHIVGGHYGYPYEFLSAPSRFLPITAGQIGGSGAQGICYNEDGLPHAYRGGLFFCDWGLQAVFRYTLERKGATFAVSSKTALMTKGDVGDFRPFSIAASSDGASLYVVDWAYNGWLADGPRTGRLYRLSYRGSDAVVPKSRPTGDDVTTRLQSLDHPAHSVRLESQRILARRGASAVAPLAARLAQTEPETGRYHALWALDAIGTPGARRAIRAALADQSAEVRLQAARSVGIRGDREAVRALSSNLRDPEPRVRREAAIALGKIGETTAAPALLEAIGDSDPFAAWSIRQALRRLNAWNTEMLTKALLDPARCENALELVDEAWSVPVVDALVRASSKAEDAAFRARLVATLAGLARKYPPWSGRWFGTDPLAGAFPQKTEPWDPVGMARVQVGLTAMLVDTEPSVRLPAIAGLLTIGRPALPTLRTKLGKETDPKNLEALATGLGILGDFASAPALGAILQDRTRADSARAAALDALGKLRGPQALSARIGLVYDPKAPAELIARALPSLGREGIIPPNDLAGFLENADPSIRSAALLALTGRKQVPVEVQRAVLTGLDDADGEVKKAAMAAVVALELGQAVPKLLALGLNDEFRTEATLALANLPDTRALPVYLSALRDRSPVVRRAAESALAAIRDQVRPELEKAARDPALEGAAALALERVMTRFEPITHWRAIGPFARTTPEVFVGDRTIDFKRSYVGAEGRPIAWSPRKGDANTGRVVLDDLKAGAGDRGGFGYDTNGSPDLCAFGYAEIQSDRAREALLLLGSSGTMLVTLNERVVFDYTNFAGRAFDPDSDIVRIDLVRGTNRLLVKARQGIGVWSFGARLSLPSSIVFASTKRSADVESLRSFASSHDGDPKRGEAIFFDEQGVGCVKCHSAAGKGTSNVGPDLSGLASKYDKSEIIRSVLEPSNRLATGYQPALLATRDGKVLSGLVRAETDQYVELVDIDAKLTRVPKESIVERRVGTVSLMPANLAETLSVVEFADLISFLRSLKTPRE